MNKLPCEVVQDLFPAYIEELSSEATKSLVEEHVVNCEHCKKVLSMMNNPGIEPLELLKEKKEIDFLKKTRRRNRKKLVLAVVTTMFVLLLCMIVKQWLIGSYIPGEYVACQVQVKGNELSVNGTLLDARYQISNVKFAEENGVVTISFQIVRRGPFGESRVEQTYMAKQPITAVHLGERILWADGKNISAITSAVYQTGHPYIGDMPANDETANALNLRLGLGNYTSEIQTTTEPYEWKFLLDWDAGYILYNSALEKINRMDSYAYILLAVIDNLEKVVYEYRWGNIPALRIITKEQATEFAGEDIKRVGKDIAKLQQLMEQAELPEVTEPLPERDWTIGPNPGHARKQRFIMDSPAMKIKGTAGFAANEKKLNDLDALFQEWEENEVIFKETYMDDAEYVVTA